MTRLITLDADDPEDVAAVGRAIHQVFRHGVHGSGRDHGDGDLAADILAALPSRPKVDRERLAAERFADAADRLLSTDMDAATARYYRPLWEALQAYRPAHEDGPPETVSHEAEP